MIEHLRQQSITLPALLNAAKNKHQQQLQASGKAINAKVRLFGRIGRALPDRHADEVQRMMAVPLRGCDRMPMSHRGHGDWTWKGSNRQVFGRPAPKRT